MTSMTPKSGNVIGTMWYKSIMQSSSCPNGDHPSGYSLGKDQVNWAIVIKPGTTIANYFVRIVSNTVTKDFHGLTSGLNYNSAPMSAGRQRLEVWDGSTLIFIAQDGRCVSSGCPDGIFNMNDIVVGVVPYDSKVGVDTCPCGGCPPTTCATYDFAGWAQVSVVMVVKVLIYQYNNSFRHIAPRLTRNMEVGLGALVDGFVSYV